MPTRILDHRRISLIVERFAVSAREFIPSHLSLVIVGIEPQGLLLARLVSAAYAKRFGPTIPVLSLSLPKRQPTLQAVRAPEVSLVEGKAVLLADDVLNSGRTMAFALAYILQYAPALVKTAVLIDRDHKEFPIAADFCGLRLATSLEDHVRVELQSTYGAWLE
ncbi:MAG: phosphoribosyltransferase family protein [Flavobacteriales bacterium]|nr:phosphoribosyltransferase family protein [Flavobacteriales bacterium]MCX7769156.1 phosphoribosyltransferase family protein [Flavobacteriales bacterium]MDW8410771.1 phosphoribosyltransferase family protein [Flavobacteriales bacterium]